MTEFELQVDKEIQTWHKSGATWPWQSVANKSWEDMYDEERQIVAELYWKVYHMPHWKEELVSHQKWTKLSERVQGELRYHEFTSTSNELP